MKINGKLKFQICLFIIISLLPTIVMGNDPIVYQVQKKLNELGYDCGTADGTLGKNTVSAIKDFQRNNNIKADGKIDENIKELLGIKNFYSVNYKFSTLQYKSESDNSGRFILPEKRIFYNSNEKTNIYVRATVFNNTTKHHILFQDIVYIWDDSGSFDDKSRRMATLWFKGCPFSIKSDLKVLKDAKHRILTEILIEDAKNNVLFLSEDSALPIIGNRQRIILGAEMCINSVWKFKNKGIIFSDPSKSYITLRPMAQILFTSDGIKFDGVEELQSDSEKITNTQKDTN